MTALRAPPGPAVLGDVFTTLDAVASAVMVADGRTERWPLLYVNPAFTRLTGYSRSTALGRSALFLTGPHGDPEVVQRLRHAMAAGDSFVGELVLHGSEDQRLWVRVGMQPMRDRCGDLTHLVVTLEDIARAASLRESLLASTARLQVATQASELCMWDWDVLRDAVSYNEQWRVALGIDPQELLQRQELQDRLMLPAHDPATLELFERYFHGAAPAFEAEYALSDAGGNRKWFAARAEVMNRDEKGQPLRIIGVLRDISVRKRELQTAVEVQERWERAVGGTSDGLYDWDLLTGHVWYAARFREIIGYDRTEFPDTFMAFQQVLHPDDRSLVMDKIRKHLEKQTRLDVRCRVVTRGGEQLWCRMRGQAQRDAAGRPLRVSGSISDISGQIDAEEALNRSQDFYGTILDSLPLLISYADRQQRLVYANRQFQDFFRMSLANGRGRDMAEVLGEQRYADLRPHLLEALQGRTVEAQGRFRDGHGRQVDGEMVFVPHRDETGEVQGCFVAGRDVTEKRLLEAELRQSQKMEALGQLTGGVAHDFNNLLSVIVGNMQLLARGLRDSPHLLRQAETALNAAMRGGELTRRLLAFARQQLLEPRVIDPNALLNGMYELLRRSLTGEIEIQLRLDRESWATRIDPGQLENAMLNLVINARDAMPSGGVITIATSNLTVTATAETGSGKGALQPGDYVVIEVADTGVGMSAATLKRVFEPFFTTKDVGKGSGLGLPMVYGFVTQSGGCMTIDSAVGTGTVVRLCLPRSLAGAETEVAAQADPAGRDGPHGELPQGRETILIVEDNAAVRGTAVDILSSLGYRVLEATNGYHALDQITQHPDVALVFSDVTLPGGLPGIRLVEKLRQRRPGLKVLMTSAFSESAVLHRGMLDGSLALLTKPYQVAELARRVRAILDDSEESKRVPM